MDWEERRLPCSYSQLQHPSSPCSSPAILALPYSVPFFYHNLPATFPHYQLTSPTQPYGTAAGRPGGPWTTHLLEGREIPYRREGRRRRRTPPAMCPTSFWFLLFLQFCSSSLLLVAGSSTQPNHSHYYATLTDRKEGPSHLF